MNEILQKRIEEVAENHEQCYNVGEEHGYLYTHKGDIKEAVIYGADFALQNQWISVEESLPPIREKDIENRSWSDWVLIMTHKGGAFMDCYAFHRKEWINNGNDVTHWMEIPSLKGGEK